MSKNIIKPTLLYILISGIVLLVIIPLLYLTTVSFSNSLEINSFPKKIVPSFSETILVKYDDESELYLIQRRTPRGDVEDIYLFSDFEKASKYLKDYLNIFASK